MQKQFVKQEVRGIITDSDACGCCDDDAIISALGIGGITCNNLSQIKSQTCRKSVQQSFNQEQDALVH